MNSHTIHRRKHFPLIYLFLSLLFNTKAYFIFVKGTVFTVLTHALNNSAF